MSERYYYILTGQARKFSQKDEEKKEAMYLIIEDYIDSFFPDEKIPTKRGCRIWSDGKLAAIPATDPLPPDFKYLKNDKKWMLPKETKKGKEISKKWEEMTLKNTGSELRDFLGFDDMQFCGMVLIWPRTVLLRPTIKKKIYILISGKRIDKHPDVKEIPLGEFDDLREKSNKRAQKLKEKVKV